MILHLIGLFIYSALEAAISGAFALLSETVHASLWWDAQVLKPTPSLSPNLVNGHPALKTHCSQLYRVHGPPWPPDLERGYQEGLFRGPGESRRTLRGWHETVYWQAVYRGGALETLTGKTSQRSKSQVWLLHPA